MGFEDQHYEEEKFIQLSKEEQIDWLRRKLDLVLEQCKENLNRLQNSNFNHR